MFLRCTCGKTYRVRDPSIQAPEQCPACGRPLRRIGGKPPEASPPAEPHARVEELEGRLSEAEKALAEKDAELEEARARILAQEELRQAEQSRSTTALNELRSELFAACENSARRVKSLIRQLRESREELEGLAERGEELSERLAESGTLRETLEQQVRSVERKALEEEAGARRLEERALAAEQELALERKSKEELQARLSEVIHRLEHFEQKMAEEVQETPRAAPLAKSSGGDTEPHGVSTLAPRLRAPGPVWYWCCSQCRRLNAPSSRECIRCSRAR
jgi:hypothetical protein